MSAVSRCRIAVPTGPGIGVAPDSAALDRATEQSQTFR